MYGYMAIAYETPAIGGGISRLAWSGSAEPVTVVHCDLVLSAECRTRVVEDENVSRLLADSSPGLFSTIGDISSGQPAWGVVPVSGGAGAVSSLTSSFGGRATAFP